MIPRFTILIVLLAGLYGCNKDNDSKFIGEYDYSYSLSSSGVYQDFTEAGNWGIRVKANNRIFLFRNGECKEKGRVKGYNDNGYICEFKNKEYSFRFVDGDLYSTDYPNPGSNNYFKKK